MMVARLTRVLVTATMAFESQVQTPAEGSALGADPAEQDQNGQQAMASNPHSLFIPDRKVWRQEKPRESR